MLEASERSPVCPNSKELQRANALPYSSHSRVTGMLFATTLTWPFNPLACLVLWTLPLHPQENILYASEKGDLCRHAAEKTFFFARESCLVSLKGDPLLIRSSNLTDPGSTNDSTLLLYEMQNLPQQTCVNVLCRARSHAWQVSKLDFVPVTFGGGGGQRYPWEVFCVL